MKRMFKRFRKIILSFFIILSIVPVDIYANNKSDNDEVKVDITDDYVEIGNEYLSRRLNITNDKVYTERISNGRNGDIFEPLIGSEEFIIKLVSEKKNYEAYDRKNWSVEADNEYRTDPAENMLDGDVNTIWHSNWANGEVDLPINIIIDMKEAKQISALSYLPRQVGINGDIKDYEVYVSDELDNWGEAVKIGSFTYGNGRDVKYVNMDEVKTGRYVKFVVCKEAYGNGYGSIAELNFYHDKVEENSERVIKTSDLSLKEVTSKDVDETKKVTFTFEPYEYYDNVWNIDMVMTMNANEHYMRKFIEIKSQKGDVKIDSIDGEHLLLGEDISSYWSRPDMQSSHIDGYYLALGQPIYINSFFMGSEYPVTDTRIVDNATQMIYYSGKSFDELNKTVDNKFVSWQTVLGSSRSNDQSVIQSDFFDYIYDIATPTDFRLQFNSWYDYRLNITPDRLEDSFMGMEKGLSQSGVEPIDAYVADDGWNDYSKDFWGFNNNFPNGLKEPSEVAANLQSDFGVWFSPRGGYDYTLSFANNIEQAGNGHVNSASNDICVIDEVYFNKVSNLLLEYMKDYNIGYWKLDGFAAKPCPETDHGHITGGNMGMYYMNEVWEKYLNLFEQMRDLREVQGKDLFLNLTSYAWPSPWFLQWVNTVYIQNSGDTGFAGTGSDADRMLTYRDDRYFDFVETREYQFPLANIYNHDPVYGKEAKTSLGKDPVMTTDEFRKYLYINASRGTAFWELYYSYEWLDEEKWMVNREVINFARENADVLKNTKLIGDNPKDNNIYGFSAWDDQQGFITLRNPSNQTKSYTVTLDRLIGVYESMKDCKKTTVIPYETNCDVNSYNYGDNLTVELAPYEVVIYKFAQNDSIAPKLDKVTMIDNKTIRLSFDEVIKDEDIEVINHEIKDIKLLADYKTIEIVLNDMMQNKESVKININNISDLSNNIFKGSTDCIYYDNHLVNKVTNVDDLMSDNGNIVMEKDQQLNIDVFKLQNQVVDLKASDCIFNQEDMSISFLMKTKTENANILNQGNSYSIRLKNNKLIFNYGSQTVSSKSDVNDNQWHQIDVVKEPNNMIKIYIDGKLDNSNYQKDTESIAKDKITLGDKEFIGKIANIKILNKSLSYDEIESLSANYPIGIATAENINTFALLNDKNRLPEKINVLYDNGYKATRAVTWDITDQFDTVGKKEINGTYDTDKSVKAFVDVIEQYPVGNFNEKTLKNEWTIVREKTNNYKIENNMLTIFGTSGYIDNNTNSNDNIFLQEMPFDNCVFTTRLIGKPYANWQSGGLLAYQDDDNYIRMARKFVDKNILSFTVEINGKQSHVECTDPVNGDELYLALEKDQNTYRAYYSIDGCDWNLVTTAAGNKAEVNAELVNPKVGIYATNAGNQQYVATFDKVNYLQYSPSSKIKEIENVTIVNEVGHKLPNFIKTNIAFENGSKKDVYVDLDTSNIDINREGIYELVGLIYGSYSPVNITIKIIGETNKSALKIAIDLANAITDEDLKDVIPAVADDFKIARDEANAVYNDASASQVEVNNAFDRLASAMHMLDFVKGDKTALKAFIDKVSSLDSSKYTTDTWTAFETELNEAIAVYEDLNAMQEEVNNAYSELVTAFLNLRLIPDKSLLEELINKAEGLDSANYTKASYAVVESALAAAKATFENPNATQKEVDNAKATLEKAIAGLQTVTTDNIVSTPLDNGDTTTSVKTGDENMIELYVTFGMLSIFGYILIKRRIGNKVL